MLTLNETQMQAFAAAARARFVNRLHADHGDALQRSVPPLDREGTAHFVDVCQQNGITTERSVAEVVAVRAAAGGAFFERPDVRAVLDQPDVEAGLKAFQIRYRWRQMRDG